MTRLDDEYDPAEHHELAEITESRGDIHDRTHYGWVCQCGEVSYHSLYASRQTATAAHNRHRDEKAEER